MRLFLRFAALVSFLLVAGTFPAGAAGPITSGTTVSGSVAGPSFLESWTFSGTTGQHVVITAVTTSGAMNTNIVLKRPGGVIETSTTADRLSLQLTATGTWTIEVQDSGLNDIGTYAMAFTNVTVGPYTSGADLDGGATVSADAKTGTMSGPADIDAFTFSGTNGQHILVDAVETAGAGFNTVIYLYPPGGASFVTWTVGGNRLDFQLTATGTWTILIEDIGNDTPGSYAMSFLNIQGGPLTNGSDLDGGAILSNQIKTGTFNQGVDFDAYTFTGTLGQHVIMTALATGAGTHNTQISLYPPNGGAVEVQTTGDRLDAQLAQTGTYTIVIEESANDATGTYTMSFVNSTVGPFTDGADLDGGAIVSADVKTGTMSGAADMDAYTFSGTNGQHVLIDAVETAGAGFNTVIYLYPPGGASFATWTVGGNRLDFQLTATGTWTILIEDIGNDTAGSYSMSFLNIQGGPLTNGSDLDGGAILSNQIKTGTFNQGVDFDAFTFSGTTGQHVIMTALATGAGTHNTQISLYPPNGGAVEVQTTGDRLDAQLAQTGTYTIVIEESANDATGTYTMSFVNSTAGPFTDGADLDGGAIVSADVKTGTMSGVADMDAYTFSGTNGQHILIDAVETAGAGFNTVIYLYPPGGASFVTWTVGGNRLDFQLTATGTWTILIEDIGNDTAGSYSMSFLNVQGGPLTNGSDLDGGAIVSNQIKTGTFNQGVDFDAFTFSGTLGQHVIMTAIATGAGTHNTQISLYPPNGGAVEVQTTGDRLDAQLAQTGTYTIVIEESANDATGTYTMSFVNSTAGPFSDGTDLDGGAIVSADVKTGTMSGAADMDAYTFSGTNGQHILVDAVETAGAGFNTVIYLYPPGGASFATWTVGGNRLDFQLTATGTWTILIEDIGNDTAGSYAMSFLNVNGGPLTNGSDLDGGAIVSNQIKTGTFNQGVDFDAFTFSGTTGQHVIMTALATGAGTHNTQISLYPPNGGAVEVQTTGDRLDAQLAQTGTYTIVIEESANDATGTYTMSFVNSTVGQFSDGADLDGGPIVSADVKTGTMSGAADMDAFTFSGVNGQHVLIDAVETAGAGFNTVIYLYPPGGASFVTWTVGGNRLDFQLTSTGTWTILIEDVGNDTAGSYSMSFLNIQGGPLTNGSDLDGGAIVSNQIKTGTFNQGVDFDAFTFSGTLGQHVIMTALATGAGTHNTQISLYPPNGGAVEVQTSGDRLDAQLAQTGTYTIVIEESANDATGTYTMSFVNSTVGPFTDGADLNGGPIISNEIKTGTMSGVADMDAYTFSGVSGQHILVTAVETAGAGFNTVIYLYPPGGASFVTWTVGGNRLDFQLTATGAWTILIEDVGNDTAGSYTMSFLNVTAGPYTGGAETDGGAIVSGVPRAGTALSVGDLDGYTFAAVSGDSVHISAVVTSGAMNTQMSLFPPGGGAALVSTTNDIFATPLTSSGTYTIVIEDNVNDQTGNYTVTLNRVTTATGVEELPNDPDGDGVAGPVLPTTTALLPASPSPFRNSTQLRFSLVAESSVRLDVFDVTGARVRTLVDRRMGAGVHPIEWDGRDEGGARVASGIYYVQFSTDREVWNNKVVRIR